ncbi:demethylmenaquinone methyltransferase-like [Clytia hemisphaerica]|uniref:demethylmenaquinone methyltransferase-like n=1 Tax=Clytia hemisphaerica TaxID=252671 RepID=UPI0034D61443
MPDLNKKGAEIYHKFSKEMQLKGFKALIQNIPIKEGWKILEIGCGTGNNAFQLSQMVGEKGKVVGIDPIKQRIEKAKDAFGGISNLEFHEAYGSDASRFGDDFDLVLMAFVFHWLSPSDKGTTLKSIYECLKPGGQIALNPENGESQFEKLVYSQLSKSSLEKIRKSLYHIGKDELKSLFTLNGFNHLGTSEDCNIIVSNGFLSLEDFIHWGASSLHCVDYE